MNRRSWLKSILGLTLGAVGVKAMPGATPKADSALACTTRAECADTVIVHWRIIDLTSNRLIPWFDGDSPDEAIDSFLASTYANDEHAYSFDLTQKGRP